MSTSTTSHDLASMMPRPVVVRPGRPSVRTTFQFKGALHPRPGQSTAELLGQARGTVLQWLSSKYDPKLPPQAANGDSFDSEEHGQSLHAISVPELSLWSSRLAQPDAPFPGRTAVPGRHWTTEIALVEAANHVRVGIRVLCASLAYSDAPILLTRPRIVRDLSDRFDLRDIRRVDTRPWHLRTEADLDAFHELLLNRDRTLPVYLLTQPDRNRLRLNVSEFLLDADNLAKRLQGLGHVVTLPKELGYAWTDKVGKQWSAFLGAVRTYKPRLDFENDSPTVHPLAMAERVLAFEYGNKVAEEAFQAFLIRQSFGLAATKAVDWDPVLFYSDALLKDAEYARDRASDDTSKLKANEQSIKALKEQHEEAVGLAESYASDADELRSELEELKEEMRGLRAYADGLRAQFDQKDGESSDKRVPIPERYEDMPDWVERYLIGRLTLHPRAARGLKDAVYEDIGLVYRAMLLLAREYREMKRGAEDGKANWDAKLNELGLRFDRSITATRAGEEGETYFVRYPAGTMTKAFLEFHICKGSAKNDRQCLRIYFFWDSEKEQVVVGSLPKHLDTRAT